MTDEDGDGRGERVREIASGLRMPSGVAFRDGALYVAAVNTILRFDDIEARLDDPPAGVLVPMVAQRYNLNANQVFRWRRLFREPAGDVGVGRFVPIVRRGGTRPREIILPGAPPPDPRGKQVRTQGVSVRATRKPKVTTRFPTLYPRRMAERRNHGMLLHEPPRNTRCPQSPPATQALPSDGAPA